MLSFEEIDKKVQERGLQILLGSQVTKIDLAELFARFKEKGYQIYIDPSIEDLESRTKMGEHVVLLLADLIDGYKIVIRKNRLKALILTTSKVATSKLRPYLFV